MSCVSSLPYSESLNSLMAILDAFSVRLRLNCLLKKRIFLLTDGGVGRREAVIEQAAMHSEQTRVFSFGLGSGADSKLIEGVAKAGRGTSTFVQDNDPKLNGYVINALARAMEPSMRNVQFGFNENMVMLEGEVFRNKLLYEN